MSSILSQWYKVSVVSVQTQSNTLRNSNRKGIAWKLIKMKTNLTDHLRTKTPIGGK